MSKGFAAFRKESQEGLHSLSVEDELFTAEVEDDYDALNDETFGGGLDDGWEEAHEKFAELEDRARQDSSMVDLLVDEDPLLLNQEVVEQSISHLGLEDDRDDDPAIKSYSEFTTYGSPKTDTIWTPKAVYPSSTEDRLTSLLWKLQQQSSSTQVPSQPRRSSLPPNVHTLEELERDMLHSGGSPPGPIGRGRGWVAGHAEHEVARYPCRSTPPGHRGSSAEHGTGGGTLPAAAFSAQQYRFNPGRPAYPAPPPASGVPAMPSQLDMSPPARTPELVHGCMSPGNYSPSFDSTMQNHMPLQSNLPFRPGLNHFALSAGAGPYQQHAYQTVFGQSSLPHEGSQQPSHHTYVRPHGSLDNRDNSLSGDNLDDPYAGLMTQKEKDWLVKIQLLQVQSENPDVDDYYYVMFTKRKAERQESSGGGDGDKPKFIRPERVRTESKSYTPIQFERSLGKLQVVSVNYPRKILDMGVQRLSEDEDRKVPPDRHLLWFRQLLLDIEKLYCAVLEYEDGSCCAERQLEIAEKLFTEVQPSEERFIQMVGVRKGRSLVLRVLPKLKVEHQVATLAALLRHLSWLQHKDRHDGTLERGLRSALAVIERASLNDLIQLAASLLMNPDAAFPSTFALRVAWAIVAQAEQRFQCEEAGETFINEVHKKWAKLLSEMVDLLIASVKKTDNGQDVTSDHYSAAVHLLFPHERRALASQLQRFAINSQLASELTSAAKSNKGSELHQQNGLGDKDTFLYCGDEPVTAVH